MTTEDHELSDELVDYYRGVLVTHGGMCQMCGVARCQDFLDAFDKLAAAGKAMTAEPQQWKPYAPRPKLPKP
jgi:hypothetical protein